MSSFEEMCHTRSRHCRLNRRFVFFWFPSGCQCLSVRHGYLEKQINLSQHS